MEVYKLFLFNKNFTEKMRNIFRMLFVFALACLDLSSLGIQLKTQSCEHTWYC